MKKLLISDIHGNLPALQTILDNEVYDEVIVLGDLVDYGPYPGEVIDVLRTIGARIIRGNHDHAVGYGVDCRCGEATHWVSVWFRENITNKLLSSNDKEYLAKLPLFIEKDNALYVHGSPSNPLYDYLYPWIGYEEIIEKILRAVIGRKYVFGKTSGKHRYERIYVGHTHVQFMLTIDSIQVINPGSIGQPRDGDPRAGYAVVENDTVILKRKKYPVEKIIRRYEELKIPDPYYSFLKQLLLTGKLPHR
ncbi:metallophosphoesterase [Staphylothermus marinus F1]|uniref:Metallophosphoesterase n=1 Tax=Staphylothermus marinus (strain ATCC 43588 / DSM 3639 / JCM 9404 / F1) TaxID=399550 RepID=A3DLD6_STAMF|nr:metallophosphoesterase family protein [Staphylothermus marinus]ABN69446.1 metallophosphoesterase [Staphylothermus marinus F1]